MATSTCRGEVEWLVVHCCVTHVWIVGRAGNLDVIAGVVDGLGEGSDDLSGEGEGGGEAVGQQEARGPGQGKVTSVMAY